MSDQREVMGGSEGVGRRMSRQYLAYAGSVVVFALLGLVLLVWGVIKVVAVVSSLPAVYSQDEINWCMADPECDAISMLEANNEVVEKRKQAGPGIWLMMGSSLPIAISAWLSEHMIKRVRR
jgi:hypothetical protein